MILSRPIIPAVSVELAGARSLRAVVDLADDLPATPEVVVVGCAVPCGFAEEGVGVVGTAIRVDVVATESDSKLALLELFACPQAAESASVMTATAQPRLTY